MSWDLEGGVDEVESGVEDVGRCQVENARAIMYHCSVR